MKFINKFIRDEKGATAIEYGLIAGLIAVVIIVAVTSVGTGLSNKFDAISKELGTTDTGTSTSGS